MRIKNLLEGLNAQQRSVPQLPAQARAKKISVLGAKTDPKHPFAGYMVGADESAEPGRKRLGPDKNDPWEKGWRAGFRQNEFNPYPADSKEARQWDDGYAEARAQPDHYNEGRAGVDDTDTVGFYLDTERAYQAVMGRYGDMIDHDETSGIMYVPSRLWPKIEMIAFDADGIGALRHDDDMSEATGDKPFDSMMQNISKGAKKQAAVDKKDQKKQSQQQARDAFGNMFGGNPAGNLKIREQGVAEEQLDEKCWDGYEKKGMKTMFGKRVPNCVKNEGEERNELDDPRVQAALAKMAERHKGEKWSKEQLAALGKRIAARGKKPVKEDVTKEDVISKLKAKLGDYLSDLSKEIKSDPDLVDKLAAKAPGDQMGPPVKTVTTDDGHEIQIHGNEDDGFRISIKNKPAATQFKNLDEAVMACEMYCARRRKQTESADYIDEAGKDACYHKVKSRYKIWPSAYASGALVRCRKVGADNWGNKSKK